VWQAVERACDREDFRHRSSRLCDYCAFQAWCPAYGGDPTAAPIDNRLPFPSERAAADPTAAPGATDSADAAPVPVATPRAAEPTLQHAS
jgi:putative RecB family exonuclease